MEEDDRIVSEERSDFELTVYLRGIPAYMIDKILESGFYGNSREEAVQRVLDRWAEENFSGLCSKLGASREDAIERGYLPREREETESGSGNSGDIKELSASPEGRTYRQPPSQKQSPRAEEDHDFDDIPF